MKSTTGQSLVRVLLVALLVLASLAFFTQRAYADEIPKGWEASNLHPIGYSDMDGRAGNIKMAIKHVNDHWYLYVAHLWHHGWTIMDVTDPTNPKVVKFIQGPPNGDTNQVDLHDNIMITALQNRAAYMSHDMDVPRDEGVIIWDISDPVNPKQLSLWKTNGTGTHRNGYPGGKYANLAAGMPGYNGQILVFLDISDPTNPKEASRFWMPGQKDGEPPLPKNIYGFHGPAYIDGDRAYLGYTPWFVLLDISDILKPKLLGSLSFDPPFGGIQVHDAMPIPGKPFVFVHSEGTGGADTPTGPRACTGPMYLVAMVDINDPTKPKLASIFPTPVPPSDVPYKDFCEKGGRFGPHNTNILQHSPDVEKQADLIYLTYFNAGLRIYDVKDPRLPKEVGWFIPPQPTKRLGPYPYDKLVNQTENVLVDTRGNIFVTDRQLGLFVLRYTGPGEPAPTAK